MSDESLFSRRSILRLALLASAIIPWHSVLRPAEADDTETIAKIVKVWKERGDKAKTIEFELVTKETIQKGSVFAAPELPPSAPLAADVVVTGGRHVWFDGEKMRDVLLRVYWRVDLQSFAPAEQIEVFTGKQGLSLMKGPGSLNGGIRDDPLNTYRANLMLAPMIMHFRGFAESIGSFKPDKWKVVSKEPLDDRECIVIEQGRSPFEARYQKYWIDPVRGWSIVKYESYFLNKVENRLSVQLREDHEWGWLPAKWTTERHMGEHPTETVEVTAKSLKTNAEIAPNTFHIEFPLGTRVTDRHLRKTYVIGENMDP